MDAIFPSEGKLRLVFLGMEPNVSQVKLVTIAGRARLAVFSLCQKFSLDGTNGPLIFVKLDYPEEGEVANRSKQSLRELSPSLV